MPDKKASKSELEEARRALSRGEPWPAGLCYDPDRYPEEFYPCSDLEQSIAEGKVSVSHDGVKVADLMTGKVSERDVRPKVVPTTSLSGAAAGGPNTTVTTEGAHP